MSHDRTDRIQLANDVARCEPSGECSTRGGCARYLAAIPRTGAVFADFGLWWTNRATECPGFIDAVALRKEAAQVLPQAPKPAVKGLA